MFKTENKSYFGCHPDIACALKRNEDILCYAWNGEDIEAIKTKVWITGYIHGMPLPYISSMGVSWVNVEPIETRTYRKKASEIIGWLEDNGYTSSWNGSWRKKGWLGFDPGMYELCNKPNDTHETNEYIWLSEWLEER